MAGYIGFALQHFDVKLQEMDNTGTAQLGMLCISLLVTVMLIVYSLNLQVTSQPLSRLLQNYLQINFSDFIRGSVVSFTIVLCQYLRHCLSLVRDVTPLTSNVAYKTVQGLCASRLSSLLSEWPSDFTAKKQAAAMEAFSNEV